MKERKQEQMDRLKTLFTELEMGTPSDFFYQLPLKELKDFADKLESIKRRRDKID